MVRWLSHVLVNGSSSKPYYVWSADESMGGSVGVCFVLFQVVDIVFLMLVTEEGRPELGGQNWRARSI